MDLDDIVTSLEEAVSEFSVEDEDKILLDNRCIDDCIKDQIKLQLRWERIYAECCRVHDMCKAESERLFSEAFHNKMTKEQRAWGTTEAKILSEGDPQYVAAKQLENRAGAVRRDAEAFLKTIVTRQYALKNMVDLVLSANDKYII